MWTGRIVLSSSFCLRAITFHSTLKKLATSIPLKADTVAASKDLEKSISTLDKP